MAFFKINRNAGYPDPQTPVQVSAGVLQEATAEYVVPAGGAALNAVIEMVPLPARARVVDALVSCSAAATLAVGEGGDDDRYVTSGAVAAGGLARLNAHAGLGYGFPAADTVDVKLGAALAAGAVLRLAVTYVVE